MKVSTDRIRERLTALGKNPSGASLEAGLQKDAIRNILRGLSVNVRTDTMMAVAAVLDCSVEYLMGVGDTIGPAPPVSVVMRRDSRMGVLPVKFEVGAGYWRHGLSEVSGEWGPVSPHPRYPDAPQWLERVIGDGALEKFAARDLVHVVEPDSYTPVLGDYVIVVLEASGLSERSIRRVVTGRDKVLRLACPTKAPGFGDPIPLDGSVAFRLVGKIVGFYSTMD